MLSPVPCWHFSDDKETSAILATVLGFPHDSGNSDDVPAKPPDKVLKVMGEKGAQDGRHSRATSPGRVLGCIILLC